jgi:hypothetical protein
VDGETGERGGRRGEERLVRGKEAENEVGKPVKEDAHRLAKQGKTGRKGRLRKREKNHKHRDSDYWCHTVLTRRLLLSA